MAWKVVVKTDFDVDDTIKLIVDTVNEYSTSEFVEKLKNKLLKKSSSLNSFLHHLFDYVCNNVEYQLDPPTDERVTTPERLIRDGIGDCKKMTTLIASVLKAAGITPLLKVISYDGTNYEHIYVIVPDENKGYITLDPVNNCKYNAEIPHKKAKVIDLNNKEMPTLSLLGRNQSRFQYVTPGNTDVQPIQQRFLNSLHGPLAIIDEDMDFYCPYSQNHIQPTNVRFLNYLSGPITPMYDGVNPMYPKQVLPNNSPFLNYIGIPTGVIGDDLMFSGNCQGQDKLSGVLQDAWTSAENFYHGVIDAINTPGLISAAINQAGKNISLKDFGQAFSNFADYAAYVLKRSGLAPARGAFLLVVKGNLFNMADLLAEGFKSNPIKIKQHWESLGGIWGDLRSAINQGKTSNVQVSGIGEGVTAGVTIASAMGLITSFVALLTQMGVIGNEKSKTIYTDVATRSFTGFEDVDEQGMLPIAVRNYWPWALAAVGVGLVYKLIR